MARFELCERVGEERHGQTRHRTLAAAGKAHGRLSWLEQQRFIVFDATTGADVTEAALDAASKAEVVAMKKRRAARANQTSRSAPAKRDEGPLTPSMTKGRGAP